MNHFYIISYSSNRYGDMLMKSDYRIDDGYDEFRNGAGTLSSLMQANPLHLRQWLKGNPGEITKVLFKRRVPKKVTTQLSNSGKGYSCPCWEVIVHYLVEGKEFISYTRITKSCI